jgi:hypothetical protein
MYTYTYRYVYIILPAPEENKTLMIATLFNVYIQTYSLSSQQFLNIHSQFLFVQTDTLKNTDVLHLAQKLQLTLRNPKTICILKLSVAQ